jgi:hypothetical protein
MREVDRRSSDPADDDRGAVFNETCVREHRLLWRLSVMLCKMNRLDEQDGTLENFKIFQGCWVSGLARAMCPPPTLVVVIQNHGPGTTR